MPQYQYQPNRFLERAVESGSADKVRGALVGIIRSDPGFWTNELDDAVSHAQSHGIDPFEPQNDPQLPMDNGGNWDIAYFASALTYLRSNFTRERLEHVRAVGRQTHPAPKPAPEQAAPVSAEPKGVRRPKKARGHQAALAAAVLLLVALAVAAILLTGRPGPDVKSGNCNPTATGGAEEN